MDIFGAGWIATPMEVVHTAQTFWWIHMPFSLLWLHRKWHTDASHQTVRQHVREGHEKHFTRCQESVCATL